MIAARVSAVVMACALGCVACGDSPRFRSLPPTDVAKADPSAATIDGGSLDARPTGRGDAGVSPDDATAADTALDTGADAAGDALAADTAADGPAHDAGADLGNDAGAKPDTGVTPKLRYYPGFWLKATGDIDIDEDLNDGQLNRMYKWIEGDTVMKRAVVGMVGAHYWATYETEKPDGWNSGQAVPADLSKHHFDWTQMDRILAWHEKRGLRYWAMLREKTFNRDDLHAAPGWAQGDFEYNRPLDSGGKCSKKGNIVPIWQTKARDAFAVFVRAFVERYGDDDRLGMISLSESDPWCSELPNNTKQAYSRGQMHMMTVAREAGPTLNIVKLTNYNLWEMINDHARSLSPPVGLSGPDVRPFKNYPDGALYATTHAYAREHANEVPVFWQVQAPDLHKHHCINATAWEKHLPQCKTQGTDPCEAIDVTCYLVDHVRVDGIAFATYEDVRTKIVEAIHAYKDALPASSYKP